MKLFCLALCLALAGCSHECEVCGKAATGWFKMQGIGNAPNLKFRLCDEHNPPDDLTLGKLIESRL